MAIELNRPRWLLSHSEVAFARSFLTDLGFVGREGRKRLALKKGASSLDALKVIDMYEDAAMKTEDAEKVRGNWVQKFESDPDALLFLDSQFFRYQEVEAIVNENFEDLAGLRERVFSSEGKQ